MRRSVPIVAGVFVILALLAPAASAAPHGRHYEGETSAGKRLAFRTSVEADGVHLESFLIEADLPCTDGSIERFVVHYAFGDDQRIVGGSLDLDLRGPGGALILTGHLGPQAGLGTIRMVIATLDAEERPQRCDTGDLAWNVARVERGSAMRLPTGVTRSLRVGGVTRTIVLLDDVSESVTARPIPRMRHYRGRIAPDGDRFTAVIGDVERGQLLLEMSVSFTLDCDDGSRFGAGVGYGFGRSQWVEPWRIDFDDLSFDTAVHVHGRLGAHTGEGTTSMIVATLDEDLEPQACRSGERTWTAWRTDAGY